MKNKIILTDADGVLVSWINGFHQWMNDQGFMIVDESQYDIHKKFGISKKQGNKLCWDFSHSNYIMTLKPFEDAKTYVPKIANDFGYKFRVITSLSDDEKVARMRKVNLESLFGPVFEDILCLPHGDNKHNALLQYQNLNYIWVEDKIQNANLGTAMGLYSFLIDRPYNQVNHEYEIFYRRINSWKEIYEHLLLIESE